MRYLIICLTLLLGTNTQGKTVDKLKLQIDSLTKRKSILENELESVTQEIEAKEKLLTESQNQEPDKILQVTTIRETVMLDSKSVVNGKKVSEIKKGERLALLNYENNFYFVSFKGMKGYVYYVYLNGITNVNDFKTYWTNKNAENQRIEKRNELAEKTEKRYQRLSDEFGAGDASKLIEKQIWIGMTDKMAIASIGLPDKVNRSNFSSGTHEQWVYKDKYLYFENGVLTSWQEEN